MGKVMNAEDIMKRSDAIDALAERIYIRTVYPGAPYAEVRAFAWEAARAWYVDEESGPVEAPVPAPAPEPEDAVQRALDKLESWKSK